MTNLHNLLHITRELAEALEQSSTYTTREGLIADVNRLVEKRGRMMNSIHPPFTDAEQQTGKEIVKLNEIIQTKLNQLFAELKIEMKDVQKHKRSHESYTNPYSQVASTDGMFMDRKN